MSVCSVIKSDPLSESPKLLYIPYNTCTHANHKTVSLLTARSQPKTIKQEPSNSSRNCHRCDHCHSFEGSLRNGRNKYQPVHDQQFHQKKKSSDRGMRSAKEFGLCRWNVKENKCKESWARGRDRRAERHIYHSCFSKDISPGAAIWLAAGSADRQIH